VIKEGERSFDLEVMRGASATCRLLIELPSLFYWKVSRTRPSAAAHAMILSHVRRYATMIVRKLAFFGGRCDPLKKRILPPSCTPAFFFQQPSVLILQGGPETG
jgi:hypothetical protein